jgi:uncharacterized protein HemY
MREAVEGSGPSPLRSCVLGTLAFSSGQLAEAELRFSEALAQARDDPDSQPLADALGHWQDDSALDGRSRVYPSGHWFVPRRAPRGPVTRPSES